MAHSQGGVLHYDLFLEARNSAPFVIQLNEKLRRVSVCFADALLLICLHGYQNVVWMSKKSKKKFRVVSTIS